MYRFRDGQLQDFLAHPRGPYFTRKDDGYWTIRKGELDADEDLLEAAKREFEEETGIAPKSPFIPLTPVNQNLLPWNQPPVRWFWKGQSGRRTGSRVWQAKRVPPRYGVTPVPSIVGWNGFAETRRLYPVIPADVVSFRQKQVDSGRFVRDS